MKEQIEFKEKESKECAWDGDGSYFLLSAYSIDYLYINIRCVYKFMKFFQYIFLKALGSLDRDYIVLILLPQHQSFIQDAPQKKKGNIPILSILHPAQAIMQ